MAKEEKKEEGNEGREVDFSSKPKVAGGGTGGGACGVGGGRDASMEGKEGCKSFHERKKERERESLRPFVHRHRGLTRVSSMSHPMFLVLLSPFGIRVREAKGEGCTVDVRERATPRMTQVPQSLTRLRLFCHLLLSFELFYRLPR